MCIVLQIRRKADIKIVLLTTQTPLTKHGDLADAELRLWNLDTVKRTRKNDTINSTQNASLHRPNKEKIQKTQPSTNEEDEKANHRCAEGSSSNTDCDQDSDITFMEDTDKERDTGEIDGEDWIEHVKRRTAIAVGRMKTSKNPCCIETHRRMK